MAAQLGLHRMYAKISRYLWRLNGGAEYCQVQEIEKFFQEKDINDAVER